MNITIQNQVHASTNKYKTVCGLPLSKKYKVAVVNITCPFCKDREEKRIKEIQAYINKQIAEIEAGAPIEQGMWRLVGYVEGGLRQS